MIKIRNPNTEIRNNKGKIQIQERKGSETKTDERGKIYDLEERTLEFSKKVRIFVRKMPQIMSNLEDGKQLIRSSGSIGANYMEANEALSKKDFLLRIRICRKEAKESRYWLRLLDTNGDKDLEKDRSALETEAKELMNIFGSILRKSE